MTIPEIRFYLSEIEKMVDKIEEKNDQELYFKAVEELKAVLAHLEIDYRIITN